MIEGIVVTAVCDICNRENPRGGALMTCRRIPGIKVCRRCAPRITIGSNVAGFRMWAFRVERLAQPLKEKYDELIADAAALRKTADLMEKVPAMEFTDDEIGKVVDANFDSALDPMYDADRADPYGYGPGLNDDGTTCMLTD